MGGKPAFLMGFDTDRETVYQVRSEHGHQQLMEIIPGDYARTLVTDRGPSYEAKALQGVEQSKCMSHLLRNLSEVVDTKRGPAKRFGTVLKEILMQGHQLWRDYLEGKVTELTGPANEAGERLKKHLRHRRLRDPDNQSLLDGIGLQNDQGRVFWFLQKPEVEPTNNRAERILRPAVIARKVSHCSKTERGAHAHAAFQSVLQTAKKVGTSFSQAILQLTGLQ